jgi:hypothetical protein
LKSDGPIKKFTPTGLLFEDGSTLDGDVVIFATGFVFLPFLRNNPVAYVYRYSYGDARSACVNLIKNADLHDKIRPIWGLDDEGELNGSYREIGVSGEEGSAVAGLWCIIGNLALCRFHSKHLALRTYLCHRACGLFLDHYKITDMVDCRN